MFNCVDLARGYILCKANAKSNGTRTVNFTKKKCCYCSFIKMVEWMYGFAQRQINNILSKFFLHFRFEYLLLLQ